MTAKRLADLRTLGLILAGALAALIILNFALVAACNQIMSHSTLRLSRITRGNIDTDVLVVGNSRGVNLITGRTSKTFPSIFNLAYNGIGRRTVLDSVEEYFLHGNKAKIVLVEASALLNESSSCQIKSYWKLLPLLGQDARPRCPDDARAEKYFPLTLFNSEIFLRSLYYLVVQPHGDQGWTNEYRLTKSGCIELQQNGSPEIDRDKSADTTKVRSDIEELRQWLHVKSPKTKLAFVLSPYFAAPATMPAIRAVTGSVDNTLGKGAYLDLSQTLGGNCTDFADAVHTNGAGRMTIMPKIIAYLAEQNAR